MVAVDRGDEVSAYLGKLRLQAFRNYSDSLVSFEPGLSVLLGRNGQGKSNVLEAVCYLALLRSFRTHTIGVLRQWGADSFVVEGEIGSTEADPLAIHRLEVSYGERRTLALDGNLVDRASEFINQFQCVPLVPEDIDLVRGPARERRRFLDILCTQTRPAYLGHLQSFHLAIRSRNAILRASDTYPEHALAAYDELVVAHGTALEVVRGELVGELNRQLAAVGERLFVDGGGKIVAKYSSFWEGQPIAAEVEAAFRESLDKSRIRDTREMRTCVGPHLANVNIHLAGRPLARYGSEGECRMSAIALRLASLGVIRGVVTPERAVVLLVDDVFGELDSQRRRALFECVAEADQVLITATELPEELPRDGLHMYQVESGSIESL